MKKLIFLLAIAAMLAPPLRGQEESDTVWTVRLRDIADADFTPDASKVVVAMSDWLQIYDTKTGNLINDFGMVFEITNNINQISVHPDGTKFVTVSDDGKAVIWSIETGDTIMTLIHDNPVMDVQYSQDGKRLYTIGYYDDVENIYIWNDDGTLFRTISGAGKGVRIACSPVGDYFATVTTLHDEYSNWWIPCLRIWDAETFEETAVYHYNEKWIHVEDMCFSPDGSMLALADSQGEAKVWDIANKKFSQIFKESREDASIRRVAFSPDSKYLVIGEGADTDLRTLVWLLQGQEIIYEYNFSSSHSLDVSNDGEYILTSYEYKVQLLNARWYTSSLNKYDKNDIYRIITPNPSYENTKINFFIPESGHTTIKIIDMNGIEINTLIDDYLEQGEHSVNWSVTSVPPGIYFCKIQGNNFSESIKIVVNK